eukprot:m.103842 g.103842  ORF g.103842 m.103842 type:complete len:68 (-) comp13247_c0_seq5:520-723(-)
MTLGSVVTVIMAGLVHEVLSLQDIAERDADGIHELLSIVSEVWLPEEQKEEKKKKEKKKNQRKKNRN